MFLTDCSSLVEETVLYYLLYCRGIKLHVLLVYFYYIMMMILSLTLTIYYGLGVRLVWMTCFSMLIIGCWTRVHLI